MNAASKDFEVVAETDGGVLLLSDNDLKAVAGGNIKVVDGNGGTAN